MLQLYKRILHPRQHIEGPVVTHRGLEASDKAHHRRVPRSARFLREEAPYARTVALIGPICGRSSFNRIAEHARDADRVGCELHI